MECIYCGNKGTRVIDKRDSPGKIRRRRECLRCSKRFTTYEQAESAEIIVVKKDGRREPFQREKLLRSIRIACQKRPVSEEKIDKAVMNIEFRIKKRKSKEVPANIIGKQIMKKLMSLDRVAYIRFASVYRSFEDIKEFEKEVKELKKR